MYVALPRFHLRAVDHTSAIGAQAPPSSSSPTHPTKISATQRSSEQAPHRCAECTVVLSALQPSSLRAPSRARGNALPSRAAQSRAAACSAGRTEREPSRSRAEQTEASAEPSRAEPSSAVREWIASTCSSSGPSSNNILMSDRLW